MINAVVYAEISVRFERIEELDAALASNGFDLRSIPREAAFLAGKIFLQCRRAGGRKSLPSQIFSSEPMQPSRDCRCSPVTNAAFGRTSPRST